MAFDLNPLKARLLVYRWWLCAIGAALVLLTIYGALTAADRARKAAVQAGAAATFGAARTASAQGAINTIDANGGQSASVDLHVKGSIDALNRAAVGDRDNVALRELCGFASARNDPQCRVFKPSP